MPEQLVALITTPLLSTSSDYLKIDVAFIRDLGLDPKDIFIPARGHRYRRWTQVFPIPISVSYQASMRLYLVRFGLATSSPRRRFLSSS